jgi:HPt (histidine-containing phosphotransfer) domain-containing protein
MKKIEASEAASITHKLKGSAGNLALINVASMASELDRTLRAGENPNEGFNKLQSELDIAFKSIAHYVSAAEAAGSGSSYSFDQVKIQPMLNRLIRVFDTDSPDEVEPVLAELHKLLSPVQLKPINVALEQFDFRGGETATRELAANLGVTLET